MPNVKPTRRVPLVPIRLKALNEPVGAAFAPLPTPGNAPARGHWLLVVPPGAVAFRTRLLSLPPPNGWCSDTAPAGGAGLQPGFVQAIGAGVEPGSGLPVDTVVSSSTVPQTVCCVRVLSTTNSPGEFKAFKTAVKALTPSEPSLEPLVPQQCPDLLELLLRGGDAPLDALPRAAEIGPVDGADLGADQHIRHAALHPLQN